ncbi:MAG: hypothetical protein MI923_29445 [Phycisphaerales bacterium]|nr:hypothetical protein [Phycisphaerales bacterium]
MLVTAQWEAPPKPQAFCPGAERVTDCGGEDGKRHVKKTQFVAKGAALTRSIKKRKRRVPLGDTRRFLEGKEAVPQSAPGEPAKNSVPSNK